MLGLLLSWIVVNFFLSTAPSTTISSLAFALAASLSNEDEELFSSPLSSDFSSLSSSLSGNEADMFYSDENENQWSAGENNNNNAPALFGSSSSTTSSLSSSSFSLDDNLDPDPNLMFIPSSDSTPLDLLSSSVEINAESSNLAANPLPGSSNSNSNNNGLSCAAPASMVKRNGNEEEAAACISPYDLQSSPSLNLMPFIPTPPYSSRDGDDEDAAWAEFPRLCPILGFPVGLCCEGPVSEESSIGVYVVYNYIENCRVRMYLFFNSKLALINF